MTRTIFQKITSSLWVLISFIPLFNGLGFVYIGNKYGNANWFAEGILYEIPWLLGLMSMSNFGVATVFFIIASLASYVSIIRSIMVDFKLQKQLNHSNVIDKSFEEKINDVVDSLWVMISFIPILNGVGLIYKGKTTPNKSWFTEGLVYELPWILGFITWGIQPVRSIAFEVALIFYFASIIRSVMVASEPKPIYGNRVEIPEEAEFKVKSKETKEENKSEKESVGVKIEEGTIPAFQFYRKQFKELEDLYPQKEKNALELIEKRFAPPQLTYTRFKGVVDDSHETFYSQLNAGYKILDLSTEYSTKVEDELKNKVIVLNSIIKGLDKLSAELVLNISQIDTESDDDIKYLFDEFKRATRSVSAYE
ncbi:hypothetical protein [Methanobrevibacter sp.]|uniref:hypothetical protein n=1 Tax=Methanobrevibacter sp. TaxID=66852 RepID=UPI0025E43EAF|nr:hypothetical protein [Methanobrevibacter sp.]MBQ2962739.1 hypothetical protein [Methanobrevibacter sp.]